MIHGKVETWWENGKRRWIENYFNGKRHGQAYYWDVYGKKPRIASMKTAKEVSCKKLRGLSRGAVVSKGSNPAC